MTGSFRALALLAGLLLLVRGAEAREPVQAGSIAEGEAILIDGLAEEAAWAEAIPVTDFVGSSPTEGFEPAGQTRVRVLSDAKNLYFFFEARFDDPETRVRAYYAEREAINRDDQVAIYLDPFGDGRRAYVFWLNALGVQQDMLITLEGDWNPAWDAVFRSRGRIVEGGYDLEVAIPFRSLRFPKNSEANWRVLFKRKFTARDEYVAYPALSADLGHELLQYAELQGVQPGRSGVGLELNPTVVLRAGQDRDSESGELAWRKPAFLDTVDPGFGLKWQVTPSLTLDATINPDFSQIEADPDRIDNNLRFALHLPERRPFFLEGKELFNGFLLSTRSIVDPIYGVKFSGKAGRLSVAVLHALDEAPTASVVSERETPGFMPEDVDGALSFVSHAEARWDIGRRSSLSVSYSDKELLRDGEHHSDAHVLNVFGRIALDETSEIDLALGWSEVGLRGGERIHGPVWYAEYQRRTRLDGVSVGTHGSSPNFRVENGFYTQPGTQSIWADGHRRFELPGPVQWITGGGSIVQSWEELDSERPVPASSRQEAFVDVRLPGQTDLHGGVRHWDLRYAGTDFGGGRLELALSNSALEGLRGSARVSYGDAVRFSDATRTLERSVSLQLSLRALRRLGLNLDGGINWVGRKGEPLDRLIIYRVRGVIGITRALSVRVILQGRHQALLSIDRSSTEANSRLGFSALVTLLPRAGTSIHVGFGEQWSWGGSELPRTEARDLFVKGSLVLRL